jgi:hypothetical protein
VKRFILWLIPVLALAGAAAYFLLPRHKLPDDLLAAIPADAYGVVRVHVPSVLASEAYKRLVVERGEAEGVQRVTKACGFNPLERVRDLIVFARPSPSGRLPRFAFVARGDLPPQELADCVKKFSGADASTLKRDDIEGIPVVSSSGGGSRAAFLGRDGVIGGDADSVLAAINTVLGKAPALSNEGPMRDLFREVSQGTDVAVVARMPDDVKPLLQLLSLRFAGGALVPLTETRVLALNATLAQGKITGGAIMVTGDSARSKAIVELARGQVQRLLAIPGVNLTPAGSVLRSIQMEARGDRATFTGSIKVATVEALLEILPALEQLQGALAPAGDAQASGAATPPPGEPRAAPGATPSDAASAPATDAHEEGKAPPTGATGDKAAKHGEADKADEKKPSKPARDRVITQPVEKPAAQ